MFIKKSIFEIIVSPVITDVRRHLESVFECSELLHKTGKNRPQSGNTPLSQNRGISPQDDSAKLCDSLNCVWSGQTALFLNAGNVLLKSESSKMNSKISQNLTTH